MLRGSSHPILAGASDGLLYVVKMAGAGAGPNVLFNEAAGTELYAWAGLPGAAWRPVRLTRKLLRQYRKFWPAELAENCAESTLCFGSRYLGGEGVFEILASTMFKRIRNARDFWLAWLLDLCACHADNRQCIFAEDAQRRLRSIFIDHGHMFGGPDGGRVPHSCTARYLDKRVYGDVSARFILSLGDLLLNSNSEELWSRVEAIPAEWSTRSARDAFVNCLQKLSSKREMEGLLEVLLASRDQNRRQIADERRRPTDEVGLCAGVQVNHCW